MKISQVSIAFGLAVSIIGLISFNHLLKGGEVLMRVTIWKNDKESSERAITRFNKKVQASRKILKVRSERYHVKPPTKRNSRQSAIMRDKYRALKEKSRFY